MRQYTEYVVARNQWNELIVLELLNDEGQLYINKSFFGPYKAGEIRWFDSNDRTESQRQVFIALFEKV